MVSDFSARLVFKGGRPDSQNSKLVKAQTVLKVTSRNPRHSAGAHWHRYWIFKNLNLIFSMTSLFSLLFSPKSGEIDCVF